MGRILKAVREIISFFVVFIILVILLTSLGVMIFGIGYIYQFVGARYFYIPIYLVIPVPVILFYFTGLYAYLWYIGLSVILIISGSLLLYRWFPDYLQGILKDPLNIDGKANGLKELAELFSASIFLVVVITYILYLTGAEIKGIGIEKAPIYTQMLLLLHASVYEEVTVRLIYLGIPIYLWRSAVNGKFLEFRKVLGGGYDIGVLEIVFMLISSTIFGLAHVPAWSWWKFFPTFFAGMVMAYLYLKYGIHMSILFHFLNDFWSIAGEFNGTVGNAMDIMMTVIVLVGLVFTISYTIRVAKYFGLIKGESISVVKGLEMNNERNESYTGWVSINCPRCGGQIFSYLGDGKLKCLNCGLIFEPGYQEQFYQSDPQDHPPQQLQ